MPDSRRTRGPQKQKRFEQLSYPAPALPLGVTFDGVKRRVLHYDTSTYKPDNECLLLAKEDARKEFKLDKPVRPIQLRHIMLMEDLECLNGPPGLPFAKDESKYPNIRSVLNDDQSRNDIRHLWFDVKRGETKLLPPCQVKVRHLNSKATKFQVEPYLVFPAHVRLAEAQFAIPLIEAYIEKKCSYAFGMDLSDYVVSETKLNDVINSSHTRFMSISFDHLERSVPEKLLEFAYDILIANIDFNAYEDGKKPDVPGSILAVFNHLKSYNRRTPVAFCTGELHKIFHGIVSGSYFTHLISSIVKYTCLRYAMHRLNIFADEIKIFGYYTICSGSYSFDLSLYKDTLRELSIKLNESKSLVATKASDIISFVISRFPRTYDAWMAHLYERKVLNFKEVQKNVSQAVDSKLTKSNAAKPKTSLVDASTVQTTVIKAPKVETPKVETPKVETLKVKVARVEIPKVEIREVELPEVEVPEVEVPEVENSKVETPKVKIARVGKPKVELPKVKSPKVKIVMGKVPKVETPKGKTSNAKATVPKIEPTLMIQPKLEDIDGERAHIINECLTRLAALDF